MDYLCKKNQWLPSTAKLIHWDPFYQAIQSLPRNDQCRIVLFVNNKLPLRTSKSHPHPGSTLCPSCQREQEDPKHFLECDHMDRRRLFEKLHHDLTDVTHKHQLHPSCLTAMWLGLLAIWTNTGYPDVTQELPAVISTATQSQTKLGWRQLYLGRFTHQWARAIDSLNPTLITTGRQIITTIIKVIWKYILDTWSLRNQHLHKDQGHLSIPNYHQAVRTMYEQQHQLPPAVQEAIFTQPLEQLLTKTPEFLRKWIIRTNTYMKQQLKAEKKRAKLQTSDIQAFFRPCNPVANNLQPP